MKKPLLFLTVCLTAKFGSAQSLAPQVISTSGTSFNNGSSQLDWTIGEPVTATLNNGSNELTQGFHQSYLVITSVKDPIADYTVNVFPNPAIDNVNLQFDNLKESVTVSLYTAEGKLLDTRQVINASGLQLPMSNYSNGTYLLSVKDKNAAEKTYRI